MTVVALVGLPGSGKSTLGRKLARRLGVPFEDTDSVIEGRIGCAIRVYFEEQGEAAFREIEHETLAACVASPAQAAKDSAVRGVLATGGGIVLLASNRELLRRHTHAVYLRSMPDEIGMRLHRDASRPLLQGGDKLSRLKELFRDRDPMYREVAALTLETAGRTVSQLVAEVQAHLDRPSRALR